MTKCLTFYTQADKLVIHLYYILMALGGTNVWTNFSYGYRNEYPSGWLLSPERSKLILFTRNIKTAKTITKIFAYTYYANNFGEPSKVKSASQMPLDEAWDKWHDLQLEGWTFEELELPVSA